MACPIILRLISDTGYFPEFYSCRRLTGGFLTVSGEDFFLVSSPPELAGQHLRCRRAPGEPFPDSLCRQSVCCLSGFSLGRCFYVTGLLSVEYSFAI